MGGDFIGREMLLAVRFELFHRQVFARLDYNPCFDRFAAVGVRNAADAESYSFDL